ELESYFLTAYEVGGDYYDFIEFADGHPGLVIGDVSGKGTSAAFYMAEFKGVIQTLSRTFTNPRELIS
ncbi:MAG: SpoIIE family protein phosphatase, partial [Calditrichaeota bacterium]|nr:SpoIIE family protein phosphatase [Calditrichota bacterium]